MTDVTYTSDPSEVQQMVDRLKGMLQSISDTFVNASNLAETVRNLQTQIDNDSRRWADEMSALRAEIESVKQANAVLDETVHHVRQERDAAHSEAMSLRQENATLTQTVQSHEGDIAHYKARIEELVGQLDAARRDHDTSAYEAMHWEEQHRNLKAQLDGIKASLGITPEPVKEPEARAVGF